MSHDVQKYDKQVYLRVSEAQRCRVHSSLMVPVFEADSSHAKPLAVFELVQSDKDVAFPSVIEWLSGCLQASLPSSRVAFFSVPRRRMPLPLGAVGRHEACDVRKLCARPRSPCR